MLRTGASSTAMMSLATRLSLTRAVQGKSIACSWQRVRSKHSSRREGHRERGAKLVMLVAQEHLQAMR